MELNLEGYDVKIDCEHNSCSLRYKRDGETMGIMRYGYYLNVGKRVKQDIVILNEMDIDKMIGTIILEGGYSPEFGESVVHSLKEHSYNIVNNYIKERSPLKLGQAASD